MTIAWFLVLPGAASRALSTSACDAPASSGCGGAGAPRCATTLMDTATTPARHKAKRFIWVSLQFDPRSYARIAADKTSCEVKSVQQNLLRLCIVKSPGGSNMKRVSAVTVLLALAGGAYAQSTGDGPKFDAAEVHLRVRTATGSQGPSGGVLRGGRYDVRNATMVDLISMAYGINNPELVVGGPNWLERDRFDIAAKAPEGTSPENVKLMLQQLLGERFKLVLHKDTKLVPGYVLTTGKGPHKMKEANGPGAGCGPTPNQPQGPVPMLTGTCKGVAMEAFAQLLRGLGGPYITSPVTDKTGLKGYWDFDIHFTPRVALALAGSDAITVFDAVEQQLGLKLEPQNVDAAVMVVDSVNRAPSANPSGVAASIPSPPPMEFDVAELKLSAPDVQPQLRLLPGGRIEGSGITMRQL